MRATLRRLVPALLLILAACSSGREGPEVGAMRPRRDANLLTKQELSDTHVSDSYEAIRLLRPAWLQKRGVLSATQPTEIKVYLDNVQVGGLQALRSIPVNSVVRMQFLDAATATQRWGTGNVHGAILVLTM